MSVLGRLASALGRNDERPNVELAEALAVEPDAKAVTELVGALGGEAAIANDAVKVLAELGARRPDAVAPHVEALLELLGSRNNRNVWGALQAIETITLSVPDRVLAAFPAILAAADRGSVIAKDKAIAIGVKLASAGHLSRVLPALLERLEAAAPNQFPTYAEEIASVIDRDRLEQLVGILETRLPAIDAAAKKARVAKLLRRLRK